jgi:glucose-6-phosphate isomerase
MDEPRTRPLWLLGLRRHQLTSGALGRYVSDRGITGAVWAPGAWPEDDAAQALIALVEAGAKPDSSLLNDLVAEDARAAADALASTYRASGSRDGFVAVWLDPSRMRDASASAAFAASVVDDVGRANAAVAFVWDQSRAGALEAMAHDGISVALSAVTDERASGMAEQAWERGRARARDEGEQFPAPVLFFLGATATPRESGPVGVDLTTEIELYSPGAEVRPRLPLTSDQERTDFEAVVARLSARSRRPVLEDEYSPDSLRGGVRYLCESLDQAEVPERIWARDHTLWDESPSEISDRLGWLDAAFETRWDEASAWARSIRSSIDAVLLLGMGGSSLGAGILRACLGGSMPLNVLDTTDPDHIASVRDSLDLTRTLVIAASKSGTTVETRSHLELFWSLQPDGARFAVITDPGTELARLASERGFARVFENRPDVGGRFSVLTYFGLAPAAACGVDGAGVLHRAREALVRAFPSAPAIFNSGARLAGAIADAQSDGRDKLTLVVPDALATFGDWMEQLVSESLGKRGTGVVPVCGERLGSPEVYGQDRLFVVYALGDAAFPPELEALEAEHPVVRIRVADPRDVGGEIIRWELAVAILGHVLEVNPFDQPDVEAAKARTREALESQSGSPDRGSANELLTELAAPSYLAIQAFIAPTADNARRLAALRERLRSRYRVAVTVGFGPRFLHSTGQLHKGGPTSVRCLQVTGPHSADIAVPGSPWTFGRLIDAQADGDLRALRDASRAVARVSLTELESLAGE